MLPARERSGHMPTESPTRPDAHNSTITPGTSVPDAAGTDVLDPAHVLRVMTININQDRDIATRMPVLADLVLTHQPDVLCLQEVTDTPELTDDEAPRTSAEVLAARTGMHVAVSSLWPSRRTDGRRTGVAVLTRTPPDTAHVEQPRTPAAGAVLHPAGAALVRSISGRAFLVGSAHLPWGAAHEPTRTETVARISSWLGELSGHADIGRPDDTFVTVLTGDFNSDPDSSTLRYLTGREGHGGSGTFWLDSFEHAGTGVGATSGPSNPWLAQTARSVGIRQPHLLPERRIDYVMVRGWVYGRPGCPLSARVIGATPTAGGVCASDHAAVLVELWDPPLSTAGAP